MTKDRKLINVELIKGETEHIVLTKINGVKDYLQKGYDLLGEMQFVNGAFIQYVALYDEKKTKEGYTFTYHFFRDWARVTEDKSGQIIEMSTHGLCSVEITARLAEKILVDLLNKRNK